MAFQNSYDSYARQRRNDYDYDYLSSRPRVNSNGVRVDVTQDTLHHISAYDYRRRSPSSIQRSQKRRPRWPPRPSVQEEQGSDRDEASSRGTVDQEPLIIDLVAVQARGDTSVSKKPNGRRSESSAGVPTPPTSDDEKFARGRRKASRLDVGGGLPEMMRASSPYAFSKPAVSTPGRHSHNSVSSPESLTPPRTGSLKQARFAPTSTPTPLRKSSDSQRQPSLYGPRPHAHAESRVIESLVDSATTSYHERANAGPPGSDSHADTSLGPRPTSSHANVEQMMRSNNLRRPHLSEETRRYTDSSMDIPRQQITDSLRRPGSLKVNTIAQEAVGSAAASSQYLAPTQKIQSHESPITMPGTPSTYPPSPPHSPRATADRSHDDIPYSAAISLSGSKDTSAGGSPHNTTHHGPSALPATDSAWRQALDKNAARHTRPPTRLASSTSVPEENSSGSDPRHPQTRSAQPLPYPVDNTPQHAMPELKDHQFFSIPLPRFDPSPVFASNSERSATPANGHATTTHRPSTHTHHSATETPPTISAPLFTSRQVPADQQAPVLPRSTPLPVVATPLPLCPRRSYTQGYDDWHTLDDCPNFDICPHCFNAVFAPLHYRSFFRRSPLRPTSAPIKCSFSDPWMRLAWLLTVQRQQPSLYLLKALANHNLLDDTPCPDTEEAPRCWYTMIDHEADKHIRKFTVCASDVRKVTILLPDFRNLFVLLPSRSSVQTTSHGTAATAEMARMCAFRTTQNNRFPTFIDYLISIHESAHNASRKPIITPFTNFVKRRMAIPECPRDNKLFDQKWFFMPSLPNFTVCEDCFEDVVRPLHKSNFDLAMRFNQTSKYVPSSPASSSTLPTSAPRDYHSATPHGSNSSLHSHGEKHQLAYSCQLYSPKMRQVFNKACLTNDFGLLAKKAKERYDIELDLQERNENLRRRRRRLEEDMDVYERAGKRDREREREFREEKRRIEKRAKDVVDEWLDIE